MSLDVSLKKMQMVTIYSANITHNLAKMAVEAGIYKHLWHPEDLGITQAAQLIEPIQRGLAMMKADPARFAEFDSPNGWGTYKDFVPWIELYLYALEENPDAEVHTST